MTKKRPLLGFIDILLLIGLLGGAVLLAYPFVSDAWVTQQNQALLSRYDRRETRANKQALKAEYQKLLRRDETLNRSTMTPGLTSATGLADSSKVKAVRDEKKLNAETIARISIPKINAELPIFGETTDWLLQFGACRLDGTNYPVGLRGDHAVISAHRGVPNATLFTHLPQLVKGDRFYITVGDHHLAYAVVKKQVIEPTDTKPLLRVPGQDLVTLMTCTPYMINSQRLLVTGRRVAYTKADANKQAQSGWVNKLKFWAWVVAAIVFAIFYWRVARLLIVSRRDYRLTLTLTPGATVSAKSGWFGRKRELVADAQGQIDTLLPGARYRLRSVDRHWRVYVRRIKDATLTVK